MARARTAERVRAIEESATFAVADMVKQLRKEGREVFDLGGGDPDFVTAEHIGDAAIGAIRQGDTHYVASRGTPELRDAIAHKLESDNHLKYDPASEIVVTPSAKHALFIALLATLDPGDEMIVLSPSWVSYEAMLRFIGAVPRFVALDSNDGFRLTAERLRDAVTAKTKAVLVNTPNNPTGRALSGEEASMLAALAEEHDLLLVADEIYEKVLYDGVPHVSLGALPGCSGRTITINGFSKAYAMTGWRLGYVAAPRDITQEIVKAQQHTVGCAGSFIQAGGLAALAGPQDVVSAMLDEYGARRKLIVDGLNELGGVRCALPDGAFYAFPNIEEAGLGDDVEFAGWLLERAGVAVTPGSAFGPGGEGHVRLSFANDRTTIAAALDSMKAVWPAGVEEGRTPTRTT